MHTFDNMIFNVNGDMRDTDRLGDALKLAIEQAVGFRKSDTHGLILYRYGSDKCTLFPAPLSPKELLPLVLVYLDSEHAANVKCEGFDANADHDGSNNPGWRVYTENWGHVGDECADAIAVKPCFVWFGK